ncbi:MAG: cyanophycinase [Alphaproteobacteria bacterium]|nr:cyanophycinase [Alphaproteobacteria bacterium]
MRKIIFVNLFLLTIVVTSCNKNISGALNEDLQNNNVSTTQFSATAKAPKNYTSYFTGNTTDIVTQPTGGVCLMGGGTEDDNAMRWFLQKANGGDILVLRTSGSNGYNTYLYSDLGVAVNSVETIVCNDITASTDPYVLNKIQHAEAIWFAGGDQWTYINFWRNTLVSQSIHDAMQQRHIVVGGTSAGMAIMGQYYYSGQTGSVTSAEALANPYNSLVTVDSAAFIFNSNLRNLITDTHFGNRDRQGRLVTFLARIYQDYGQAAKAIACDETTSVCIDPNGTATIFGTSQANYGNVYFVQYNPDISLQAPQNCTSGQPLTWNIQNKTFKVYKIKANNTGSQTFNLNTWQSGSGGTYVYWNAQNGVFNEVL